MRSSVRVLAAVSRFPHLAGAALVAALACAVYLPFLANPPVFDDRYFLWGQNFAYYATHPFGLELRVPPYFSMAMIQLVWWGQIEAHRIVTLAFHIACALALYKLIFDIQRYAARPDSVPATPAQAHAPALVAAAVFAVHPVAVYGAGYLIQRTTLFATLFSLFSIILFLRGLARRNHADAVLAAVMYSIAVLSKETAVTLPAAAAVAGLIVVVDRRFLLRHTALYAACCAPAAALVTALVRGKIAGTEEPDFEVVAAQAGQAGAGASGMLDVPWLESVVTQAGLFFRYLGLWLLPHTGAMSFDWRTEFAGQWPPGMALLGVAGFVGYGLLGAWLVARGGAARAAGFGLLFPWILYFTEFATLRYQEAFVLYRSYLWAPGLIVVLALALARLPMRGVAVFALLALPLLCYQAHDRLQTFSSGLALWEDAVRKLPHPGVPGGSRTLYYLSREYLADGRGEQAAEIAERCLAEYPAAYDCHYGRARIHVRRFEMHEALPHLTRAVELRPGRAEARHRLGVVLEYLGCIEEAKDQYRRAARLRFDEAREALNRLEKEPRSSAKPKRAAEVCSRVYP